MSIMDRTILNVDSQISVFTKIRQSSPTDALPTSSTKECILINKVS
jgi:hypothetical protein